MHGIAATTAVAGNGNGPQPRLVHAAREFEAQMMKELLKPMTSSGTLGGEDDDAGSGGVLAQFASEALGRALSMQGGFGIGDRIVADLSRSGTGSTTAGAAGNLHNDTGIRTPE